MAVRRPAPDHLPPPPPARAAAPAPCAAPCRAQASSASCVCLSPSPACPGPARRPSGRYGDDRYEPSDRRAGPRIGYRLAFSGLPDDFDWMCAACCGLLPGLLPGGTGAALACTAAPLHCTRSPRHTPHRLPPPPQAPQGPAAQGRPGHLRQHRAARLRVRRLQPRTSCCWPRPLGCCYCYCGCTGLGLLHWLLLHHSLHGPGLARQLVSPPSAAVRRPPGSPLGLAIALQLVLRCRAAGPLRAAASRYNHHHLPRSSRQPTLLRTLTPWAGVLHLLPSWPTRCAA
jgi:hypothetical protein